MKFDPRIGKRIKAARERSGLSVDAFARHCRANRATVYRWEKGEVEPSLTNLRIISEITGVSVDSLLWEPHIVHEMAYDRAHPRQSHVKPTPENVLRKAYELKEPPKMHILPVANKIAADLVPTFSEAKETILVDVKFDSERHYCLMVKGRSMHPTIMEGDIVVVKQVSIELEPYDPERGPAKFSEWVKLNKKVVCAQVDGEEPQLKRIFVQDAAKRETGFIIYLRGDNPQSRMITIENETTLRIVGQVQQIIRDPNNFE